MFAPEFEYHKAATVAEAIQLLNSNEDAKLIGDSRIVAFDFEHHIDLVIGVLDADRNTAGGAPDRTLVVRRAEPIHDLGDITPGIDDFPGDLNPLRRGGRIRCRCQQPTSHRDGCQYALKSHRLQSPLDISRTFQENAETIFTFVINQQ